MVVSESFLASYKVRTPPHTIDTRPCTIRLYPSFKFEFRNINIHIKGTSWLFVFQVYKVGVIISGEWEWIQNTRYYCVHHLMRQDFNKVSTVDFNEGYLLELVTYDKYRDKHTVHFRSISRIDDGRALYPPKTSTVYLCLEEQSQQVLALCVSFYFVDKNQEYSQ